MKGKTSSKHNHYPSVVNNIKAGACHDPLIPTLPAPPERNGAFYPNTLLLHNLPPFRLNNALTARSSLRFTGRSIPSRLDRFSSVDPSGNIGRRLPFSLNPTREDYLPSRLDSTRYDHPPSKLDSTRKDYFQWRVNLVHKNDHHSKLADPSRNTSPPITTAYTSKHDIKMASRQILYDTLSSEEQTFQEDWVQEKIQQMAPCPYGLSWRRIPGGYHCIGGHHYMSDKLLAKGKGGWYIRGTTIHLDDVELKRGSKHPPKIVSYPQMPNLREVGFRDGLRWFRGPYYSLDSEYKGIDKDCSRIQQDLREMIKKRRKR
jgi:hypothetical protein